VSTIERWLPHRPPFRFVDELVAARDDGAEFLLRLATDDPRLRDGALAPLFLVEAVAQATAAFHGYTHAGAPEAGVLVEIQRAALHAPARGGDVVDIAVRRLHSLGALARFAGRVSAGPRLLAEAEITVARQPGGAEHV